MTTSLSALRPAPAAQELTWHQVDHDQYYVRDGIVIIPKNQTIPGGTVV
jgi:hypothetical protein